MGETMEAVMALIPLFILLMNQNEQHRDDDIQIVPEPTRERPDNEGVYRNGERIGSVSSNDGDGIWSASNENLLTDDFESRDHAIAALLDEDED